MLMNMLFIKDKIKDLYGRYERYIVPALRFLFALIAMVLINANLGYMSSLKKPVVVLLISIICAFLPSGAVVAFGALLILGHILSLSVELGAMVFVVFALLLCLYFRFSPREGYLVALTPVLFMMKLQYLLPVIAGLTLSVFSFIPTTIGIFVYYLIRFATSYNKTIDEMTTTNIMENVKYILNGLLTNKGMWVYILVFAFTIILINVIKRFSIDYAWAVATVTGVVINIITMIAANAILGAGISIIGIIFGNLLAVVAGGLLYVMVFSGDYSRTETVQFEDDDYYYYVKAVPKVKIHAVKQMDVKKVNARKARKVSENIESMPEQDDEAGDGPEIIDF